MDLLNAHNQDIFSQMNALAAIVTQNEVINEALLKAADLELGCSYYIGAGCIAQSVWE